MGYRKYRKFKSRRRYKRRPNRFFKRVKRAVNKMAEKKRFLQDFTVSIQQGPDGAVINTMGVIAGTGNNQRIGNRIFVRWLKIHGVINGNNVDNVIMRYLILRGRTAGLTAADFPQTVIAEVDVDRFHCYYDRTFTMGNSNADGKNQYIMNRTIWIGKYIQYDTSTITNPTTNPVWIYLVSNDAVIPSPSAVGTAIITFTDV